MRQRLTIVRFAVLVASLLLAYASPCAAEDDNAAVATVSASLVNDTVDNTESFIGPPATHWDGFSITPYGSLWTNMVYATRRTHPGAFTLWVESPELQGEPAFEIDARRSRIGVDIVGPDIVVGEAYQSLGNIEIDFLGQFLTENRAAARIRHAYWEAKSESTRMLIGQHWDLISPLLPGTVNLSAGWSGGNIGFRRPQFRLEQTRKLTAQATWILQASLNQDVVDDFTSETGVNREKAGFPVVMARTATSIDGEHGAWVLGLSGHFGQTGFDFLTTSPPPLSLPPEDDARFNTWSVNVDFEAPFHADTRLRGEFFHGANLSPFLGGIQQGVCPCVRRGIHSTGGWLELVRDWSEFEQTHLGMGIDDPANSDFLVGRTLNQFIFANYLLQLTERLSTGLEVSWWRTLYQEQRLGLMIPADQLGPNQPGQATTIEWMVRYDF